MTRAATAVRRAIAGGVAAILAGLAGVSWHVLFIAAPVAFIMIGAVCWIIASNARTRRLALLIRAWHGEPIQPAPRARQIPALRSKRQAPDETKQQSVSS
jgi:hypothetical protein